jgi:hypothetical protein
MKFFYRFVIIIFLMLATEVQAQQHAGFIKKLSGEVTIHRSDTIVEAHAGIQLISSDKLITNDKSYASIMFTDGTTITVGPGTEFDINSYQFEPDVEAYSFSMYLKKGSAIYNSGKIGKLSPESVDISTPRASVGVRGTRFIIEVN